MVKVYKDFLTEQQHRTFDIVGNDNQIIHSNVHLVDTTVYTQVGDKWGANDINTLVDMVEAVGTVGEIKTVTIQPGDWVDKKASATVTGVTATSVQLWYAPDLSTNPTQSELDNLQAIESANIKGRGQAVDTVNLYCAGTVPTIAITLKCLLMGEPNA